MTFQIRVKFSAMMPKNLVTFIPKLYIPLKRNMSEKTLSGLECEHLDAILREPIKITKGLFSSSNEINLENFASDVNNYIQANPSNKGTISSILGVFSLVRPKQQELLEDIEKTISITRSSIENNFKTILGFIIPMIFKLDTTKFPLIDQE